MTRLPVDPEADARSEFGSSGFRAVTPITLQAEKYRLEHKLRKTRAELAAAQVEIQKLNDALEMARGEAEMLRGVGCGEWTEVDSKLVQRDYCGVCIKCRETAAVDKALGLLYFQLKGALPREVQQTLNSVTDDLRARLQRVS